MTKTKNQIQEKHLLPHTEWRSNGYMDSSQINQEESYYMQSKPNIYGSCLIYQYIKMNDGTVYHLQGWSAAHKGILAWRCLGNNLLQREIKRNFTDDTIYY